MLKRQEELAPGRAPGQRLVAEGRLEEIQRFTFDGENMRRTILAAPITALALVACTSMPGNNQPMVKMAGGTVTVEPDPIRIIRGITAPIIWQIDPSSPDVRFADNGVVVAGELPYDYTGERMNMPTKPQNELVNCRRLGDGRQFQCDNKEHADGTYKYTLRVVTSDGKPLAPFQSIVVNTDRER